MNLAGWSINYEWITPRLCRQCHWGVMRIANPSRCVFYVESDDLREINRVAFCHARTDSIEAAGRIANCIAAECYGGWVNEVANQSDFKKPDAVVTAYASEG